MKIPDKADLKKITLPIICVTFLFALCAQADSGEKILEEAYNEIENETRYNTEMLEKYFPPTFREGKNTGKAVYPNGDVNPNQGICADLVVRAFRNAGMDLQQLVHRDILANLKAYGVKTPDKYIDHRRVWILNIYLKRNWTSLSLKLDNPNHWQPGDIVVWDMGSKKHLHIGIIGEKRRHDGLPYVIHNMRYVPFVFAGKTIEQDILEGPELLGIPFGKWKIIGHYRIR